MLLSNSFWEVLTLLALTICTTAAGMKMRPEQSGPLGFDGPVKVAITEDHPWAMIKENCGETKMVVNKENNTCVYGFLVDLLSKIREELRFNVTYTQFSSKGVYDPSTKKLTELLGSVAANATEIGLSPTEQVEDYKSFLDFTEPFYTTRLNLSYSLVLAKGSRLTPAFSHLIKKLKNQRHLEQLKETWFNDGKDMWSKDKQLSPS